MLKAGRLCHTKYSQTPQIVGQLLRHLLSHGKIVIAQLDEVFVEFSDTLNRGAKNKERLPV